MKIYESPMLEVIRFDAACLATDVISTSASVSPTEQGEEQEFDV